MIYLVDLNYTLVCNQRQTRDIRPFSARLEAEEYRKDLIDAILSDGNEAIIITARPNYQAVQTLANLKKKTGWIVKESYFNDINAAPPDFKESALNRFVFPRHGRDAEYFAVESNPLTREMYARYGISAEPYEVFIRRFSKPMDAGNRTNDVE